MDPVLSKFLGQKFRGFRVESFGKTETAMEDRAYQHIILMFDDGEIELVATSYVIVEEPIIRVYELEAGDADSN